ncbi:MAG: MFS transporter [Candidatus Synoicihabitans palmerolidicus]|nr:MFS transporter [Candidatus Synoicihabitans palmerolidicus]
MFADSADYGMWKHGHRSTALIFSSAQFAQKMGLTIGSGIVFTYYGFVANTLKPPKVFSASVSSLRSSPLPSPSPV